MSDYGQIQVLPRRFCVNRSGLKLDLILVYRSETNRRYSVRSSFPKHYLSTYLFLCGVSCFYSDVLFIEQGPREGPRVFLRLQPFITRVEHVCLRGGEDRKLVPLRPWTSGRTRFVADVRILTSTLGHGPLANVAHNISPVPVLNCELLNGPEPHRERALCSPGSS